MSREQLKNNPVTTLAEALDDTETSIDVTTGSVFPSVGTYRVIVEDEIMLVTARSSNTLTVVRGAESTVAASHSSGLEIAQVLTSGSLDRYGKDNVPNWGHSSRPSLNSITNASGTVLTASSFTATNATNADIADDNGSIVFAHDAQGGSEDCAVWTIAAPGTPYSVVAAFQTLMPASQSTVIANIGLLFRKSSDGKLFTLSINCKGDGFGPVWSQYKFSSPTTFDSTFKTRQPFTLASDLIWLKIEDDGTDLNFYLSMDGVNWIEVGTEGRTAFMSGGPDEVGFYANNPNNGNQIQARLVHWSMG
jgi:hypothetical protein